MQTSAGQTGDPDNGGLRAAAAAPDTDPCDVACAALPACLIGDLAPADDRWVHDHAAGCGSCATELDRFARTVGALDRLHQRVPIGSPPPLPLPNRRRAGYARLPSPLGPLFVAASETGVCEIDFGANLSESEFRDRLAARGFAPRPVPDGCESGAEWAILVDAAAQLAEYFGRRRHGFDLPLDFAGVSPFTRSVLVATAGVPFGGLDTYRGIAQKVGNPAATRAVGNALGRNPLPVVVPCHRVVRSGGALGGYTGGLAIKRHLLALEGATLA